MMNRPESNNTLALEVIDLCKTYVLPRDNLFRPARSVKAVAGVSFQIKAGQSLGLVGESGCGKSTLARLIMGLEIPTSGTVRISGSDIGRLSRKELQPLRRKFQIVFQDPFGSLDPRQTVSQIVAEPLEALETTPRAQIRTRVIAALDDVGLKNSDAAKYPHEFSGGQRQRIAIARALVTRPGLIIADEPVSALDVSVQAQILNLLQDLRDEYALTYLLISHNLAVVEHFCDNVAVMHNGIFVEYGLTAQIFQKPSHSYTKTLLDAVLPTPSHS